MERFNPKKFFQNAPASDGQWFLTFFFVLVLALAVGIAVFLLAPEKYEYSLVVPLQDVEEPIIEYGSKVSLADFNFFEEVRQSFIEQKANFVSVDLNKMLLEVYKNGEKELEVPVAAKGRVGSWWETPAGLYKIRSKERDHVTSFGGLHMPWSMQFHGNFFIHGWPYFPDGTLVSGSASGGCVRLTVENAKKVYDFVELGMPVLVHEDKISDEERNVTYLASAPEIKATHYLAVDLASNHAILKQNHEENAPLSHLSNLLVALVAAEHINIKNNISISSNTVSDISEINPGFSYRVYDLLFPLLQVGSDTAAKAFAGYRGEDTFLKLMQEQASSIGMQQTNLVSTSPLLGNTASPKDVFALAKYLYSHRSFLLDVSSGKVNTSIYGSPRIQVKNKNFHVSHGEFKGGLALEPDSFNNSTAGLAVFHMKFGNSMLRPIAFIAMGSISPHLDIENMYNFVKSNYTVHTLNTGQATEFDGQTVLNIDSQRQKASILEATNSLNR